ncbi:MAG TPA: dTDP-4-dehydrorhamnose 3,5-epimerase [Pseudolabrys sp.]|jgi:dTDP-4-dehydrorhamnose 3,5-epimerase
MRFTPMALSGAYLIQLEPRVDARGTFARAFCAHEFAAKGLTASFVQANISSNVRAGTVRGLHFQNAPHTETKLVQCVKGSVYDVIVDIRKESATYLRWAGVELSDSNGAMMYVPAGFAHGYQTLSDGANVLYLVSEFYAPEAEGGLRYSDPKLEIEWPLAVSDISEKDGRWPLLTA